MTFKCTCEEARADFVRERLLRAALPYFFYTRLLNRPVFEFASADDMMRAIMAADGELMMPSAAVPPRGAGMLRLGVGTSVRMAQSPRGGVTPGRPNDPSRSADPPPGKAHKQAKAL